MIAGTGFRLVDVDDVWPRYAARAARCGADAEHLRWVVARCQAQMAVCLECDDGIVVLTAVWPQVRLLLAVSQDGGTGVLQRREAEVLAVAKDLGGTVLSFRTDRVRAWSRVLGPAWQREDDRFWRSI